MKNYKPQVVFFDNSELLESCEIDNQNNLLYFVSIYKKLVYCLEINTGQINSMQTKGPVGCVRVLGYKKLIVAETNGIYEFDFRTLSSIKLNDFVKEDGVRFNDGRLDSNGRFLIGTMGYPEIIPNKGKLYSYFKGNYTTLLDDITISNGIAFTNDNKTMFYIDTPTKKVVKFNYDLTNGTVSNKTDLIEFDTESLPDGMCIDSNQDLLIAEWGGGCISRWDSRNGNFLQRYQLPVLNITSCAFDIQNNIYITTAKSENIDEQFGGALLYLKFIK
jgi:sugar lactone lactonase YvrE